MATDLFDHLAEEKIPEPPGRFDQEFHAKLNRTLLSIHFIEIFIRTFPWFLKHFGSAVVGVLCFTMTGDYQKTSKTKKNT